MKKYILFLVVLGLFACDSKDNFKINGTIADANKKTLYLEHIGLVKTEVLDSVKLDKDGDFHFKGKRPQYADFYRLRLGVSTIDFAVDSCETITFKADGKDFGNKYSVEGSTTSATIQKLRNSINAIQAKADALTPQMGADERRAKISDIEIDIENHKKEVRALILQNPRSAAAYYAIYQQINNNYIFSPYVKEDKPYCAAVATAYNAYMPEYERTKNLYNLVMDAIRTERKEKANQEWAEILNQRGTGYIDIALKDRNGNLHKLSDLQGKTVIIDFSSFEMPNSVQYIFALRELYNKYHSRGLEIYQISLDQNQMLWEESSANIPWICVRDEKGANTTYVTTYNVQSIPTIFVMDKKGDIISRSPGMDELNKLIAKSL